LVRTIHTYVYNALAVTVYANICSGVGFKRFVFDLATRNGGSAEFDVVCLSCGCICVK